MPNKSHHENKWSHHGYKNLLPNKSKFLQLQLLFREGGMDSLLQGGGQRLLLLLLRLLVEHLLLAHDGCGQLLQGLVNLVLLLLLLLLPTATPSTPPPQWRPWAHLGM